MNRMSRAVLSALVALLVGAPAALAGPGDPDFDYGVNSRVTQQASPKHDRAEDVVAVGTSTVTIGWRESIMGGPDNPQPYDSGVLTKHDASGSAEAFFTGGPQNIGLLLPQEMRLLAGAMQGNKLITVGYMEDSSTTPPTSDWVIARWDLDQAALDGTFGTPIGGMVPDGVVIDDFGAGEARALDVAVDADGKIVVVGWVQGTTGPRRIAVARYTADGDPDTLTFGTNGRYLGTGAPAGNSSEARAVAIQPGDGKILVGGQEASPGGSELRIDRLTTGGALDAGWDDANAPTPAGTVRHSTGGLDLAGVQALLTDGTDVIAAGYGGPDGNQWVIARFLSSGAVDAVTEHVTGGPAGGARAIVKTADRYVAAGSGEDGDGESDFLLAGYGLSDIAQDESFGTETNGGLVFNDFGDQAEAYGLVQVGDRLIAAGYAGEIQIAADGHALAGHFASGAVTPQKPTPTGPPSLEWGGGTLTVGKTVTGGDGTWTGAPTSYEHRWQRCDPGPVSCAYIKADGTSATVNSPFQAGLFENPIYPTRAADVGKVLRLKVWAANGQGRSDVPAEATTPTVEAAPPGGGGTTDPPKIDPPPDPPPVDPPAPGPQPVAVEQVVERGAMPLVAPDFRRRTLKELGQARDLVDGAVGNYAWEPKGISKAAIRSALGRRYDLIRAKLQPFDVVLQSPAPGTPLEAVPPARLPNVAVSYYDPSKDPRRDDSCYLYDLEREGVRRALAVGDRGTGTPLPQVQRMLDNERCDVRIKTFPAAAAQESEVRDAKAVVKKEPIYERSRRCRVLDVRIRGAKPAPPRSCIRGERTERFIELSVATPAESDFAFTFIEGSRAVDHISFAADGALTQSLVDESRFAVMVNEMARGSYVDGLAVFVYDPYGELVTSSRTKNGGKAEIAFVAKQQTNARLKYKLVARFVGENGNVAEGVATFDVKFRDGSPFVTWDGRYMAFRAGRYEQPDKLPPNLPRAHAAQATLGDLSRAAQKSIYESNLIAFLSPGQVSGVAGLAQARATRQISDTEYLREVNKITQVQNGRVSMGGSPTGFLIESGFTRMAALDASFKPFDIAALTLDRVNTVAAGVIASGGGNIIASGGGNVIASGGGNIIASGGGNLIGQAGTNLIGQAGTNFVATNSGTFVATNSGTLIGQAGTNARPLPMNGFIQAGKVIASGGGNVIASGGGN